MSLVLSTGALVAGAIPAAAAPSPADGNVSIQVTPGTATVAVGQTVTVTVEGTVTGNVYGFGAYTVDVTYNPAVLQVDACAAITGSANCNYAVDTVRFTSASPTGASNFTLGTITFRGQATGTSDVLLSGTVYDAQGNEFTAPSFTNGTVKVPAVVTGLSQPAQGPASGGTYVAISGTGLAGTTAVYFGDVLAADLVGVTDTQVVAITPPGQANTTVDVTVEGPNGRSSPTSDARFTYVPDSNGPFVGVWVDPETSYVAPGQEVTVEVRSRAPDVKLGSWQIYLDYDEIFSVTDCAPFDTQTCDFSNPGRIVIAGNSLSGLSGENVLATVTFQSNGTRSIGLLGLRVEEFADPDGNPAYPFTATGGQIVVSDGPVINTVEPASGWSGGGTRVALQGANFLPGASVAFGGSPATGVDVQSGSTVRAETPAYGLLGDANKNGRVTSVDALCILRSVAGLPGTANCPGKDGMQQKVDVTVQNPDGQSYRLVSGFTYWTFDVSRSETGEPSALDALCTLRIVAGLPSTAACPAPVPVRG